MTRVPPSNLICCLDGCQDSNPLDSRVEVKTLLPTQGISRIKAKLLVNWRENGEAEFHVKCWETILELSRKRYRTYCTVLYVSRNINRSAPSTDRVALGGLVIFVYLLSLPVSYLSDTPRRQLLWGIVQR